MKSRFSIIIIIGLAFSVFFIFQNSVLAINAPTVTFVGGDDVLQNGGTDDPYDSLIIFKLTPAEPNPEGWEMDYSDNGGNSWTPITAEYQTTTDEYFWSTSYIYAPTLLFRARSEHSGLYSEYAYATLTLSHRQTNPAAHYFVEDYTTSDNIQTFNKTERDDKLHLQSQGSSGKYHSSGWALSEDLLDLVSNDKVTQVIFQPVQGDFGQTIRYQVSNDGTTWYGPDEGDFLTYPEGTIVPAAPVTITFDESVGDELYWRVQMSTGVNTITPYVYQLRFDWQENYSPQACFTVEPPSSNDPDQVFVFDASCSTDYEDGYLIMDYRWDFNGDDTWELDWQQGRYNPSYNYGSTSTQNIVMEVRDSFNVVDSFTGKVNAEGEPSAIFGWAWSGNYGWTSLNCDNVYYGSPLNLCPPNYGLTLDIDNTIYGWIWDNNIGWICFGNTCAGYGDPPLGGNAIAVYDSATGEISGWAKYLVYGNQSVDGWIQLRGNWCDLVPNVDSCVYVDLATHRIYGYAWNGFDTAGVLRGVGWIEFLGNVSVPWLETKYGQVYGKNNVGSNQTFGAPDNRYNSTYCIRAGGDIVNFSSESGCLDANYNDLSFPLPGNKYTTILGVINFDKLANAYENVSYTSDDVDQSVSSVTSLGNKVYNFTGETDYYINEPITFYNARNLDSSGAGTIIINGNLHINSNLYYESNAVTSQIENLATVAWIVKGDVIIDDLVSNVVGNFIIVGPDPSVPCPHPDGCGEFKTGNDILSPRQLVVNGLVMARKMSFERYFKLGGEPAEKIIYDGRVMVNTPPGLEDVTKGLPVWREAIVSTDIE